MAVAAVWFLFCIRESAFLFTPLSLSALLSLTRHNWFADDVYERMYVYLPTAVGIYAPVFSRIKSIERKERRRKKPVVEFFCITVIDEGL